MLLCSAVAVRASSDSDNKIINRNITGNGTLIAESRKDSIEKDSVKKLEEVVVTADNYRISTDKSEYFPSKRQKNISVSATDLLRHMGIPQLIEIDGGIKPASGGEVSYFINGNRAEGFQLTGMRMKDVREVVYMDYPEDARYEGEAHVVEFIVQEYEYGGYTKVSETASLISKYRFKEQIYSDFTYKKMKYVIDFTPDFNKSIKYGEEKKEYFRLSDRTVERTTHNLTGSKVNETYPLRVMASYKKDGLYIQNDFGFQHNGTKNDSTAFLTRIGNNDETYDNSIGRNQDNDSFQYSFYIRKNLYSGWALVSKFNVTYRNSKYYYSNSSSDSFESYYTAKEKGWNGFLQIGASKRFGKNSLTLIADGKIYSSKSEYNGSAESENTMTIPSGQIFASFSQNLGQTDIYYSLAVNYEKSTINNDKNSRLSPNAGIQFSWVPDRHNMLDCGINYSSFSPSEYMRNPEQIHIDRFMYARGTPGLRPSQNFSTYFTYTYINNNLNISLQPSYSHLHNRLIRSYSLTDNGNAILSEYANKGNCNNLSLRLSANAYLLSDNLHLSGYVHLASNSVTHGYMPTANFARYMAKGTYYLGNCYIEASLYAGSGKGYSPGNEFLITYKPVYFLTAGWGNGDFNLKVSTRNVFNFTWKGDTSFYDSSIYSHTTTPIGADRHSTVTVTAAYTFGYGKEVSRKELNLNDVQINSAVRF